MRVELKRQRKIRFSNNEQEQAEFRVQEGAKRAKLKIERSRLELKRLQARSPASSNAMMSRRKPSSGLLQGEGTILYKALDNSMLGMKMALCIFPEINDCSFHEKFKNSWWPGNELVIR